MKFYSFYYMLTVGTRSISDEISMVELSKCFDSEERELLQQSREKDKDKDKEKTEKYKEKEDRDEGIRYYNYTIGINHSYNNLTLLLL